MEQLDNANPEQLAYWEGRSDQKSEDEKRIAELLAKIGELELRVADLLLDNGSADRIHELEMEVRGRKPNGSLIPPKSFQQS